ncbi:GDSL-type esterase/lipase family protein [Terribacillus sp. 179-K 1B1 HS]|uniref:GDSL-type esterase/lipase family protein n=1 Tax=Terribacillus sp. 179-K 1B1 HS TaxID=3142388 RepID=UPI0039A3254C
MPSYLENVRDGIGAVGYDFRETRNVLNADVTFTYQIYRQIQNLILKAGDSSPENIAARTSYTGETYLTIGDRMDSEGIKRDSELATKADQSYVDTMLSNILDGSPDGVFSTYAALVAQYPKGAPGTFLVLPDSATEEAGHIYFWDGASWKDAGIYQGIELKDSSVTRDKLSIPKRVTGTVVGSNKVVFDWTTKKITFTSSSLSVFYNDEINDKGIIYFSVNNLADIDISSFNGWIYTLYADLSIPSTPSLKVGSLNTERENAVSLAVFQPDYTINQLIAFGNKEAFSVKTSSRTDTGFVVNSTNLNIQKRFFATVDPYTEILFDWEKGTISFPDSKLTLSYNDFRNATIRSVEINDPPAIDVSGLNNFSRMLYVNLDTNEVKVDYVTAGLNNIAIICYFAPFNNDKEQIATFGRSAPFRIASQDDDIGNSIEQFEFPIPRYKIAKQEVRSLPSSLDNYFLSGRWYPKTFNGIEGVMTIQQGQEIYAKVYGTSKVVAKLMDTTGAKIIPPRISYSVDGGEWVSVLNEPGYTSVPIATNLDDNEHYIRIMVSSLFDDSFSVDAGVFFAGFEVDEGAIIEAVEPDGTTGFYMGDSITAGRANYQDEGGNGTGTIKGSRAELGYAAVAGDILNSRVVRNAFGGTGIVKSLNTANAVKAIDYLREGLKDTNNYNPDYVVINHGTNDKLSEASDGITADQFKDNYRKLLDRCMRKYSGVPIFMMIPFGQYYASEIRAVASEDKYKGACAVIETAGWNITYTDGLHPDEAGSALAGQKLAEVLISKLGSAFFN